MAYDLSAFEARRRAYTDRFGQSQAMNAYANFLQNQQTARTFQDLTKQYADAVPKLMSSYGQRGLAGPNVQSGIQRRALQEFAANRAQNFGDLQQGQDQGNFQYGLGKQNDLYNFNANIADLESDKAAQMSADARALLQYRYGG